MCVWNRGNLLSILLVVPLFVGGLHGAVVGGSQVTSKNNSEKFCFGHSLDIPPDSPKQHLIIAHRGASAHLPEHTLAAYQLALELGADFIEPDLVATSDGRLMAMHTSDLTVTTNVIEVFGETRSPWFSPFANRSGYWAFNFTADEVRMLKVRQRIPAARTTLYDNLFGIPMLEDILNLLQKFNSDTLSKWNSLGNASNSPSSNQPTRLELAQAGLYAELKDSVWLRQEAGTDLVQLLIDHVQAHETQWHPLLKCSFDLKHDEFKVPGLVIQSFDVESLKSLRENWPKTLGVKYDYPTPPSILLVSEPICWTDEFWFEMGHRRSFVDGIGPDKNCMLDKNLGSAFVEKAREFGMVLHPWTERPETNYLVDGYNTVFEETKQLLCHSGAQAVFSESITPAVTVVNMGCKLDSGASSYPSQAPEDSTPKSQFDTGRCRFNDNAALYMSVLAFGVGVLVAILIYHLRNIQEQSGHYPYARSRREFPNFENELELT